MNNVQKPELFLANLIEANRALYDLFILCREKEPAAAGADGGQHDECFDKSCFEVSGQYRRPGEFLAALLDIIRVTYEPNFIGSLFLNANPAFIYENVPKGPFQLGYLSVVGEAASPLRTSGLEKSPPRQPRTGINCGTPPPPTSSSPGAKGGWEWNC